MSDMKHQIEKAAREYVNSSYIPQTEDCEQRDITVFTAGANFVLGELAKGFEGKKKYFIKEACPESANADQIRNHTELDKHIYEDQNYELVVEALPTLAKIAELEEKNKALQSEVARLKEENEKLNAKLNRAVELTKESIYGTKLYKDGFQNKEFGDRQVKTFLDQLDYAAQKLEQK